MFSVEDAIKYFVNKKFGLMATLAPKLATLGNQQHNVTLEQENQRIEDYKATLRNMPKDELLTLHKQSLAQDAENAKQAAIHEEQNRFYNVASANADFVHWSKAAHWTLDEAIGLSFGKEPDVVNWRKIEPLKGKTDFAKAYAKRYDLAKRAKFCKQFNDAIPPVYFINWANDMDIELPQSLVDAVEKYAGRAINWRHEYIELKSRYDEISKQPKEPTRKLENLLQALTAIAIDDYGYNPDSAKSSAPTDIAAALAKFGQKVDPKTIRGWLREGSELLPQKPDSD